MSSTTVSMEDKTEHNNVIKIFNKYSTLKFERYRDGTIYFSSNGINMTIKYPSSGSLVVESSTKPSYLNLINIVSKTKKLDLNKLMKRLDKCINEQKKDSFSTLNDENFDGALKMVSEFDLESAKEMDDIEKNLDNAISPLICNDKHATKRGKIFSSRDVANLLLAEYKKIKKELKDSSKYSISVVDNNIYVWRVKFKNFSKKSLNSSLEYLYKKFGYDNIELNLHFHSEFYPNYPINIKYIRPRLNNSLMYRLSNLRMINSEYWSPSRSALFVIQKLYKILEDHADIDIESFKNDPSNYSDGAYFGLESELIKLSSFCGDIDNGADLDDEEYEKIENNKHKNSSNNQLKKDSKASGWDSGTGYGSYLSTNWNPQQYIEIQKEKEELQCNILKNILNIIASKEEKDLIDVYNIIEGSYLIKYIKSQLKENSAIEIDKKKRLFEIIFQIMQYIATEQGIFLFACNEKEEGLYTLFENHVKDAEREKKILDSSELSLIDTILTLNEMIKPIFKDYNEKNKFNQITKEKKQNEKIDDNSIYVRELEKFRMVDGNVKKCNFSIASNGTINNSVKRAITKELSFMQKSLPIHRDTSSFYIFDESALEYGRFIITGPSDTPYDSGIYVFDVYYGSNYPHKPPSVKLINNGNKRFNPNLYDSGKVCLSLLGTWEGERSEKWVPNESTLYQVILSIQSLILISEPTFNEPGHEASRGTESGDNENKRYNNSIRLYTMTHSINDMLENPNQYDGIKDIVLTHFKLKKSYILETCKKWVDESLPSSAPKYEEQYKRMIKLFDKFN